MKISLKERRVLIIWTIINLFALTVNLAGIYGTIRESRDPQFTFGTDRPVKETVGGIYLFTAGTYQERFWPFQSHFLVTRDKIGTPVFINDRLNVIGDVHDFYGIFNSYNYPEFIVYMLLGLLIIFLPKLWNPKSNDN